jgi:hypothetical protein
VTARTRSAKLYYDKMAEAGAVSEREVSVGDRACKPTEESEKECSPGSLESWTTTGHSHELGGHALESSSNMHSSSNHHPTTNGLINTELFCVEPVLVYVCMLVNSHCSDQSPIQRLPVYLLVI